jgi:hypothetical protein
MRAQEIIDHGINSIEDYERLRAALKADVADNLIDQERANAVADPAREMTGDCQRLSSRR